ncbi:hypothetical protein GGI11_006635 [Coemansia sp. RSA 2049]|nr:hypothetical protein GGI11_006635 [Coemansia sp. RSA 2049]
MVTASVGTVMMDDNIDDEDDDDDDNSSEDADKETKDIKKGSSRSGAIKCLVGKTNRREAPYKRFRNSFIFFANERRKQWKREHPEVTKIQNRGFIQGMSKVWNGMSAEEKEPYMRMAEEDKLRYEEDVKKYGPLPTGTPSSSTISSGAGTATSTTPTGLPMAQVTISTTEGPLNDNDTSNFSLKPLAPNVVPIASAPADNVSALHTTASSNSEASTGVEQTSSNNNHVNVGANAAVAAVAAAAAAAIVQPTPIAPAFISSALPLPVDTFGVDPAVLGQQSYQMMLQQTFGQDFSPQAIEFDPSCFVGPEVQSADASTLCFNPFSMAPITDSIQSQQHSQQHSQQLPVAPRSRSGSMAVADGLSVPEPPSSNSNSTNANDGDADTSGSSGKTGSANGPPITTLVGTKRKSSSDGQPMTSLPVSIKRFRNSFIYFVNARRQELQFDKNGTPTNVEVNNREFLKEMSAKWRSMPEDEKAPYLKMADADKERFTREMREYEIEHPEEFSKQSRHRRRRSSVTSNGIGAGAAGLDGAGAESTKLQNATNATPMPILLPAGVGGLNIALNGVVDSGSTSPSGLLPFSQNFAGTVNSASGLTAMSNELIAMQDLNTAAFSSAYTPVSTARSTPLTTPLLTPNVSASEKTDVLQLSTGHFPSLPSVPEEVSVCADVANTPVVASSIGVAGSTAGFLTATAKVATLPTVLEGADEDVNMN